MSRYVVVGRTFPSSSFSYCFPVAPPANLILCKTGLGSQKYEVELSNAECATAFDISSLQLPYRRETSSVGAFNSYSNPQCNVEASDRGLWYQMTFSEPSVITATASDQTFALRLSSYAGTACDTLRCIANSGSFVSRFSDQDLVWLAPAGETHVFVCIWR